MPSGMPEGAMCVQRFDDSLNSAIHITYRISLRSSSMPEPRDPLLKVLIHLCLLRVSINNKSCFGHRRASSLPYNRGPGGQQRRGNRGMSSHRVSGCAGARSSNDPSAGSPTETLLRLLLPLNDRVWITFRPWVVVADLPGPVRKPH